MLNTASEYLSVRESIKAAEKILQNIFGHPLMRLSSDLYIQGHLISKESGGVI